MDTGILITYGLLLSGVIALWFNIRPFGKVPLWLPLTGASLLSGVLFERATLVSLGYTVLFGFMTWYSFRKKTMVLFLLILFLSLPLFFHYPIIGFNNYRYLNNIIISDGASPYSLYFNLDKTMAGILLLGFGLQSRTTDWRSVFKKISINLLLMCFIFLILAMALGYVRFEPKVPYFTPVWILVNLFFTCMAEEAIFRRLVQEKLHNSLNVKYGAVISILVTSILFGLAHFKGGLIYMILASLAGLFYGHIYYKTKRIESPILLHFGFNLVHFLLFTYPALA